MAASNLPTAAQTRATCLVTIGRPWQYCNLPILILRTYKELLCTTRTAGYNIVYSSHKVSSYMSKARDNVKPPLLPAILSHLSINRDRDRGYDRRAWLTPNRSSHPSHLWQPKAEKVDLQSSSPRRIGVCFKTIDSECQCSRSFTAGISRVPSTLCQDKGILVNMHKANHNATRD